MVEVVGGFPEVEDFITILYRGIESGNAIGNEKDI